MKKKYIRPRKNIRSPEITDVSPAELWTAAAKISALAEVFSESYSLSEKNKLIVSASPFRTVGEVAWGLKRYQKLIEELLALANRINEASGSFFMSETQLEGTPLYDEHLESFVAELVSLFKELKGQPQSERQLRTTIDKKLPSLNEGQKRILVREVFTHPWAQLSTVDIVQKIASSVLGYSQRTLQTIRARNKLQKVIPPCPSLGSTLKHWYGLDDDDLQKVLATVPKNTWEYKVKKMRRLKGSASHK